MDENKKNQDNTTASTTDQSKLDAAKTDAEAATTKQSASAGSSNADDQSLSATTTTTNEPVGDYSANESAGMSKGLIAGIVAVVLILGAGAWYFNVQNDPSRDADAPFELAEAETEVVRVNGTVLRGEDLLFQMQQVAQQAGAPSLEVLSEPDLEALQSQSLDAIVNTELIVQAAKTAEIEVSDADVDTTYAELTESVGGDAAAAERLAQLGVSEEVFKETLRNDIYIEKFLESRTDESALAVTEVEIENRYAEVKSSQGDAVPPLEEVRTQIELQLQFEKQQAVVGELLDTLRQGANIEILI